MTFDHLKVQYCSDLTYWWAAGANQLAAEMLEGTEGLMASWINCSPIGRGKGWKQVGTTKLRNTE